MYTVIRTILIAVVCSNMVLAQTFVALALITDIQGFNLGSITFSQDDNGPVIVFGRLRNLSTGKHGIHIHERGIIEKKCTLVGRHYNPFEYGHGLPGQDFHHDGDMGNIEANESGVASVRMENKVMTLIGPFSVVGRTVVVHHNEDKGNKIMDNSSIDDFGGIIACGVLGILSPTTTWKTSSGQLPVTYNPTAYNLVIILLGIIMLMTYPRLVPLNGSNIQTLSTD